MGASRWTYSNSHRIGETETSSSKTHINQFLEEMLKDARISDEKVQNIKNRIDEIKNKLEKCDVEIEDISWEGSYSKKTYVEGLSDIDLLVCLGTYSETTFEYKDNSRNALRRLAKIIHERYPKTSTEIGKMAVTVTFSDGIELQFLPAFKYHTGYKIPDPSGDGWIVSYPRRFKQELIERNKSLSWKLKPTIRLIKNLFEKNDINISSYHLENLALTSLENYNGTNNYVDIITHILSKSKVKIFYKMPDISEQSTYVDDYLGNSHSEKRGDISKKISKIENSLKTLEYSKWEDLFGR
jgi:predicted nucleotidyltransferase